MHRFTRYAIIAFVGFMAITEARTQETEPKKFTGKLELRNHNVPPGISAATAVEELTKSLKDGDIRIIASGANRLLVHAPEEAHDYIAKRLTEMANDARLKQKKDASTQPLSKSSSATLQVYPVPEQAAEAVTKLLQEAFPPPTRFQASGKDRIVVWADAATHEQLAKQPMLTLPPPPILESISVTSLNVTEVAHMLRSLFGKTTAPSITADPGNDKLILRGSKEQILEAKKFLAAIDDGRDNVRNIQLDDASAATVAEALFKLLPTLRDNDLKIIVPGSVEPMERKKKSPEKNGAKAEKSPPPITITAFGNRLNVATDDAEAMALIVQLVRMMQTSTNSEFETIKLKHARAAHVAQILDEAYNPPPSGGFGVGFGANPFNGGGFGGGGFRPGGGGFGGGGPGSGGGGRRGDFAPRREGAESMPRPVPARIRVVADSSTNSILLRARPLDAVAIRNLVSRSLDVPEAADPLEGGKKGLD